jgi:hypothetical protein
LMQNNNSRPWLCVSESPRRALLAPLAWSAQPKSFELGSKLPWPANLRVFTSGGGPRAAEPELQWRCHSESRRAPLRKPWALCGRRHLRPTPRSGCAALRRGVRATRSVSKGSGGSRRACGRRGGYFAGFSFLWAPARAGQGREPLAERRAPQWGAPLSRAASGDPTASGKSTLRNCLASAAAFGDDSGFKFRRFQGALGPFKLRPGRFRIYPSRPTR